MNCWEFKKCQQEAREKCPAYPDGGLKCWKVTGTMCDGGRLQMASLHDKVEFCRHCDFYIKYAAKF